MSASPVYRFDRFELRAGSRQLYVDGDRAPLTGRAYDLLVALVERRSRVVSKNELMDLVWPDLYVGENNLHVQIAALRRLLGRDAIATVPGRGYRFAVGVSDGADDASVAVSASDLRTVARATPAAAPGNLPSSLPTLFGRDADRLALQALLVEHALVTVAGPGGIGKTRIAQAAAEADAGRHRDGAWWVELASLGEAVRVPSTVGRVVGVARSDELLDANGVARALRDHRLLLVLDNCEPVLDAVVTLVAALRAEAPGVTVLVTSQEPLKVAEEVVYRIDGLDVPADDDVDAVRRGAATALFVARARAVDRRFALTAANAAAVRAIAVRLDGIPLAIEFAAARLPLLGLDGVLARLGERFKLMTGGTSGRLQRHQTMRAALQWSHALLTTDEEALFRRLAVSVGGFTLEAAVVLGADRDGDPWPVLEALGGLVDKSLILVEGDDPPRYRYLETTRLYALEQLQAADETASWRRRHALHLRDRLARAFDAIWQEQPQDLTIVAELDNVRAALDWSVDVPDDRTLAVELHGYTMALWPRVVLAAEGIQRCRAIRDRVDAATPPAIAARFWLTLGYVGMLTPDEGCLAAVRTAAEAFRALGDDRRLFDALVAIGSIAAQRGAFDDAARAVDEARALVRPDWPSTRLAVLSFVAFEAAYRAERFADAVVEAARQADLSRRAGRPVGEALALGNRGTAEVWIDALVAVGEERIRDAYERLAAAGGAIHAGHMLLALSQSLVRRGETIDGAAQARAAYALLKREDDHVRMKLGLLPLLAARRGRFELAARALGHALASDGPVTAEAVRLRALARDLLAPAIAPGRLDTLMAEGEALDEQAVFALVLADEPPDRSGRFP